MLTTREIAVVIWLLIAAAFALSNRNIRSSLRGVLDAFTEPAILTIAVLMISYVVGIVLVLGSIDVWSVALLKDTIVWFLFVSIPLSFSSFASRSNGQPFLETLLDTTRLTVLVEFLVNEYTFSLPVECILVPFVTIVLLMRGYASAFEKYSQVESILAWIQAVIGIVIVALVIGRALADIENLLTVQTAQELLLTPVMSLLLVPFIYAVLIYLSYETLFVVLKAGQSKDDDLVRYAKRRLILHLKLSVGAIRQFHRTYGFRLSQIQAKDDVDRIIASKN